MVVVVVVLSDTTAVIQECLKKLDDLHLDS